MSRAVALTMTKLRAVREGFSQAKQKVMHNVGIGVLVDGDACRCVWAEHHCNTVERRVTLCVFGNSLTDLRGDVVEIFARRVVIYYIDAVLQYTT
jgi:hypothetical protein